MLGSTDEDDTCHIYELKIAIDNVEKWLNILKKNLHCEHRKIFKVCLPIFQRYA